MSEQNKATARREIDELFNRGNFAVLDELIDPDYVSHDPTAPEPIRGQEGIRALVESYRSAFDDLTVGIDDQVAEGDMVVTRWSATGRHDGDLFGIPATGRQVTITGVALERFRDGRVVEDWSYWDALGVMRQLGVVADTPQPA